MPEAAVTSRDDLRADRAVPGAPGAFPAGGACETSPARPLVSVIIPAFNAEETLAECLSRALASRRRGVEVLVVDDGSTDRTREIAARFDVRLLTTGGRVGPASARNLGAEAAAGEILFFIDADAMLGPDSIDRLIGRFSAGDVDAVCGVQSAEIRHRNLASLYKNLWIRWTYLRRTGDVPLFYTTAAAIRSSAFRRAGGFDAGYTTPSLEDTAFGQQLARRGFRVRVQPDLEVEHAKRYSLSGLLLTDVRRAAALVRLKLRHRGELGRNNSSVPSAYIASIPLAGLATASLPAAAAFGQPSIAAAGLGLAATVVWLNRAFLSTIRVHGGRRRALAAVGLLWLELLVAAVGAGSGLVGFSLGNRY